MNNSTPNDGNLSYTWNFGDPPSGALDIDSIRVPSHLYNSSGTYNVTLTLDHTFCTGLTSMSTSTSVTINAIPSAGISISPYDLTAFDPVANVVDNSSGGASCSLIFANGDTINVCDGSFSISDTGLITIMQVVYDGTCTDTAYDYVYVKPEYIFFAPNSFSPNGDGYNDFFFGKGLGILHYEMYIYDRWGDNIFKSNNIENQWDGRANWGKDMVQEDVYVYLFQIIDFQNMPHTYVGHVTVLR